MNKRIKSTAIMMALILTISVFTSLAATTAAAAATTPKAEAATTAIAATTPTVTATPTTATRTDMTASNMNPAVGKSVTITITLKSGTTGLSKPVKIWHTLNGVPYQDGTHKTVNGAFTFKQAFGSKGARIYHAVFTGDSTYYASGGTVAVDVGTAKTATTTMIGASTASSINPSVGQSITLTIKLNAGSTKLNKPVKLLAIVNGVVVWSKTVNTVNGVYTFKQAFGSVGTRIYQAEFAGDSKYAASSGSNTINVNNKIPTTLRMTGVSVTCIPLMNKCYASLKGHFAVKTTGKPLVGAKVVIQRWDDTKYTWTSYNTVVTDSKGDFYSAWGVAGYYRAWFLGNTYYRPMYSEGMWASDPHLYG